jgi:hypothetical protein
VNRNKNAAAIFIPTLYFGENERRDSAGIDVRRLSAGNAG